MKKILTPVAILVSAFAVTAAHAEAKVDYFAGVDAGVNFGGKAKVTETTKYTTDFKTNAVYGVHGGATINDHHRLTMGYTHGEIQAKGDDSDDAKTDVDTLQAQYDYVYGLTNNINLTGGAHAGYQWYKDGDDLNGMLYGLQTGLEYNIDNWTLGTQLAYSWKDQKAKDDYSEAKMDGEATFLTSVSYHF
ncbi:hypothetical protein UB33_00360 [Photobacterium angustum]|uniref:outer membrane beta-barrel protein n=1 Tax=Photobacterium angustum TaxID=661 RepID=UPI0005E70B18|nr:outer membrane beta-barrel protein [Photobacterium angustum]KJF96252.1 hypothetical protein UB39_02710 [Photobacterium angustum]KJG08063.1 hypothetical protein UB33_00360 [Photobacterium angustum]PSV88157.1 porin family protein [Photobacterium angustum]PSW82298.1 porin family protein [Photobacterium angustum]